MKLHTIITKALNTSREGTIVILLDNGYTVTARIPSWESCFRVWVTTPSACTCEYTFRSASSIRWWARIYAPLKQGNVTHILYLP